MEIRILHKQGKSIHAIARELSVSRWTVRKYFRRPGLSVGYGARKGWDSKLDPFKDYLQDRDPTTIAKRAYLRIASLYAIEKAVRGPPRRPGRDELGKGHAYLRRLAAWLHIQLPKISGKSPLAKAIRYALDRMAKARPNLDNGVLEHDKNCVERQMKPVAIGRKNRTFAGSQDGGKAMAIAYTLIETAKLNRVDPQAWLTDVLARIADHKITRIDELLPLRYAASAA